MADNFVEPACPVGRNEHKILKFWEEKKILEKLRGKNKGKKPWSFLDGPITANNPMGVHHAWGRTLKDMFQRYKAMRGYEERFQNGFDCQGLWVEVEVEKELGFKSKKDIEQYGIEKFVEKCKERAHKYSMIQTEQSIRLGMQCDWGEWKTELSDKDWLKKSHSYYTMSDENNYGIWYFLKKCHEKKLLYKGHDVVPWCPRCGTAISQHEILTEEYKEITHKAIYFRLPVVGQDRTYFLVWTTTPWTLPANVFLSVHPDLIYAKVRDQKGDFYISLKDKASLIEGGKIIEEFAGQKMVGWKYQGLFDDLPAVALAKAGLPHKVILWDEISQEEGTGIVHSAPGCGQEDFQLSKEYGLPVVDPTNNESRYVEGFGELTGKFVGDNEVRELIFENLKQKGLVYKIEDYKHRYPTCWRCKSELIFRLVDEWYISMDKLRKPLMESAKKINWTPGFCLERELDWLKNMHDWLISKKRYWGLALPIYECPKCKNFDVIGSKEELKQRAIGGFDKFEGHSPHRPWVDNVKIKCSKCDEVISRILDVGSPWLDAGIVSFSTISDDNRSENIPYFHNNKKEWSRWFPAELVCESFPGQFKNWFYVLLVMSQVLENEPPFKNLLGFATVVDEKGEEMHKSKGNAIWFDEAIEKIGADVMRWLYVTQKPANNLRFGYYVAKETNRKLLTLWNCFTFFKTYAAESASGIKILVSKNILDQWIISKLNGLIKQVTEGLDKFDGMRASLAIENFFIEDLSLWYIRRSRKRLQNPVDHQEKQAAEQTLYSVLLTLTKLIAPMMPFLAETMYQELKGEGDPESVHLCDWPEINKKAIADELENQMTATRAIVSLALAKRAELGVGVRQPLTSLKIRMKGRPELLDLIKDEVNVKEIFLDEDMKDDIELDTTMTDELKEEGQLREVIRHIQDLRKKAGLKPADKVDIYYSTTGEVGKILSKNQKQILETTKSQRLLGSNNQQGDFLASKEVKIESSNLWLAISKI